MYVCNSCSLSLSAIWNILLGTVMMSGLRMWCHHSDSIFHVFMRMYMYATTVLYGKEALI